MGGGGATCMMQWRPWDILFANARQERGRRDGNLKLSCHAQFQVSCIKRRWREMLGGGGAACMMRQRSWDTCLPLQGGGEG